MNHKGRIEGKVTSLDLLATPFLMQPRILLTYWSPALDLLEASSLYSAALREISQSIHIRGCPDLHTTHALHLVEPP